MNWSLVAMTLTTIAVVIVALALLRRARRDEFAEARRLAAARAVTTSGARARPSLDRSR